MGAKIFPTENRVLVKMADPRKDKSEGGIWIPVIAQEKEPKVYEAEVLALGPDVTPAQLKIGDRVLIPARVLGDRLSDGTTFVRYTEVFGKVEASSIVEAVTRLVNP